MVPPFSAGTPLLQVFDMPQAVAFYRDLLGFAVLCTSSPTDYYWAMLKQGEVLLMLNTAYEADERPAAPDAARIASHGDTTLYFTCDDPHAVYAHLSAQGWPVKEPVTTHYGAVQVYTNDPDGYGLCFQRAA